MVRLGIFTEVEKLSYTDPYTLRPREQTARPALSCSNSHVPSFPAITPETHGKIILPFLEDTCMSFARSVLTEQHRQQKCVVSRSGGWKVEVVAVRLVPSEAVMESLSQAPLQLPVVCNVRCPLACGSISPISAFMFSWASPCVCLSLCPNSPF